MYNLGVGNKVGCCMLQSYLVYGRLSQLWKFGVSDTTRSSMDNTQLFCIQAILHIFAAFLIHVCISTELVTLLGLGNNYSVISRC